MAVSSDITTTYATYLELFQATPGERIERIRRGLLPSLVLQLAGDLRMADDHLALYLGLSRATLRRRIADDERLSARESEGALAMASLAGRVVDAFQASVVAGARTVDPLVWLGQWIRTPSGDLGGRAPIQYMDVVEGRALVAGWLVKALPQTCESRQHDG